MKRGLVLLLLSLLLAACNAAGGSGIVAPNIGEAEPVVVAPSIGEAGPPVVASAADDAASAPAGQMSGSESVDLASFVPATAVSEAAVIRVQDHVLGSEDPIVAIIEYGDYQ